MHFSPTYPLLLGLACFAGLAGCQATQLDQTVKTDYDQTDMVSAVDFWHQLITQPAVSNNAAFHGLIRFDRQTDPSADYPARRQWLVEQGYLDGGFDRPGNEAANRGTVAQVLCRMLGIDGGLSMRLLNDHPRYATRELVFLNLYEPSSPQQGLSGIQFVEVLSRAEDFKENRP